jgi:hypothetical protein
VTISSRIKLIAPVLFGLAFSQASFAGVVNTCGNVGSPVGGYVTISCNLAYNGTPNTFDLSGLLTQGGANLDANELGAAYTVLINGNPSTLADNSTGLGNQSLWEAVLYNPSDPSNVGYSDTLDVYWPGDFPSFKAIQTLDETLGPDAAFFVQATGTNTVIGAGSNDVFNITTQAQSVQPAATPEPASFTLLASGILSLGMFAAARRFGYFSAKQAVL